MQACMCVVICVCVCVSNHYLFNYYDSGLKRENWLKKSNEKLV